MWSVKRVEGVVSHFSQEGGGGLPKYGKCMVGMYHTGMHSVIDKDRWQVDY